jgi:hypothetical protein
MRILTPENIPFDVTQIVDGISQQKCAILDASNPEEVDYFFINMVMFSEYEYPAVQLSIGKYMVEVPFNWRILTGDAIQGELELVDIDELPNFDYEAFVLNPFKSYTPQFQEVQIVNCFTRPTTWTVPRLQKKQLLAVPLGNQDEWPVRRNHQIGEEDRYPECAFFADDTEKMSTILDIRDVF